MKSTYVAQPVDLLNFESGTAGWTSWSEAGLSARYAIIQDRDLCDGGGDHCMQVNIHSLNKALDDLEPNATAFFSHPGIDLATGSVFRFTAKVRSAQETAGPTACVDWYTTQGRSFACSKPARQVGSQWQPISLVFKTPELSGPDNDFDYFDMLDYLGIDAFGAVVDFPYFAEEKQAKTAGHVQKARDLRLSIRSSITPFHKRTQKKSRRPCRGHIRGR